MNFVEIQAVYSSPEQPNAVQIQRWVNTALAEIKHDTEIVVRIVDELESAELNQQYRHKQGATNILSFPIEVPEGVEMDVDLLGDLVVCAPVLAKEAKLQHKEIADHWAHIIVHGVLHLLGYDHLVETDAEEMERKECALLQQLNIKNPYRQVEE